MLDAVSIPIGEREWRVECVRDEGRVLAYAESHAQAPYGLLLWESAVALARSLHRRPTLVANKQVLELGAGVGLPGLVARSLGAEVWQTDHLILLRHKLRRERPFILRRERRFDLAPQHGQRDRISTSLATSRRRMVAMEFGTCRSGRSGGSSGSVTFGKGKLREENFGNRS